jgi:hypothetical protein
MWQQRCERDLHEARIFGDLFNQVCKGSPARLRQAPPTHLAAADCETPFVGHRPELRLPFVVDKDARLITIRRRTAIRVGIAVLVLAALGTGIGIGLTVGSRSSPPTAKSAATGPSRSTAHVSTTTSLPTTATTADSLPSVLSCGPASQPHVEPTKLTIGCATGAVVVTGVTWTQWGSVAGGQGTGTLNVGLSNTPAIVVVFHDVNGVFQDVSVTPTKDASTVPATGLATTTTTPLTTTSTTGGISPVAASAPGTGWGGD